VEELRSSLDDTLIKLDEAIRRRKDLEKITEQCQHWFKQADINLNADVRHSTSPEILVEHIMVVRSQLFLPSKSLHRFMSLCLLCIHF